MGFFFKDRHGKMHTLTKGYKFMWEIPDMKQYRDTVLDSDNVDSFCDVEFHFHMTVCPKGDIGFYLHYKGPPIPKYSYYLAAKDTTPVSRTASWFHPPGTSATKMSRQFTAHTIPPDTERCGHWNIFNQEQLASLTEGTDGTLMVVFQFDEDTVKQEGMTDQLIQWRIPRLRQHNVCPFTSRAITLEGQTFVLRLDRKGTDGDYFCFIFSKHTVLPPMSMRILTQQQQILGVAPRPADEMPLAPVMIPRDVMMGCVGMMDPLLVELIVYKSGNPLDQLNMGGRFESVMSPTRAPQAAAQRTAQVGKSQYVVVADDL